MTQSYFEGYNRRTRVEGRPGKLSVMDCLKTKKTRMQSVAECLPGKVLGSIPSTWGKKILGWKREFIKVFDNGV